MRQLVAALLCAATPALASPPWQIKGIEVDKPVNCPYIVSLDVRPEPMVQFPCRSGHSYIVDVSFLDGRASLMISEWNGIVSSVLATPVDHDNGLRLDAALDALTVKYGQPKVRRPKIRNRAGADFEQVTARWERGGLALELMRHSTYIDWPSLMLVDRTYAIAMRENRGAAAKKNAGNL